ncbi:hypothetical protein [Mucilaginibacter sp. AK015]|uniref:hypothetical protein n=1 Tax=Mucilaginibacter sp. AK015 TaxID=2723072 RepID=UPI00160C6ECA|nr:hypothetical protein [Mucilaginibacter sp. AK015]MBB5396825.1 hypothetical protein [Mucilaginibacter sp. AK015]
MKEKVKKMGNQGGAIYGMALPGALVYFIQHATTFWGGMLGILKAVFWPAMILYKVLELLKL